MKKNLGLIFAGILVILLNGCVDYNVGINFENQHGGAIIQKITLGKQLTTVSQLEADELLDSVDSRVKQLKGKTKRLSEREILVTIPFSNGEQLISKFKQFFTPGLENSQLDAVELLQLNPDISLQESNFLLFQREKLHLLVDLTSLGVFSEQGDLLVSSGSLVDLDFSLRTPFGAKNISEDNYLEAEATDETNQMLVWHLKPGKVNEIEVVFWVPSTLGIGTVIIFFLVIVGFYLKYRRFPWSLATAS